MTEAKKSPKKIVLILLLAVVFMFGFGYALVPLYNIMCKTLGINGKPTNTSVANHETVDKSRTIAIQFLATNNANIDWEFYPLTTKLEVHPGQNESISFYAKNNTDHEMTIQAIPSITPGLAAKHLKKTECFCFTQQTFQAHQAMEMPLLFHIDRDLPKNIHEITLAYTIFKIKKSNKVLKKAGKIA